MVASFCEDSPRRWKPIAAGCRFDDARGCFRPVVEMPLDAPVFPTGQAFAAAAARPDYVYFADPYPLTRVGPRREWEDLSRSKPSRACGREAA